MTKATADIRSLARAQTALAIRTLTGVCGSKAASVAARVSAANGVGARRAPWIIEGQSEPLITGVLQLECGEHRLH